MSDDANVMLNGFGTIVNSLKMRAKPYLPQICGTIKWRLNNKSAKIRQQAADLIARIAVVMKVCARSTTWSPRQPVQLDVTLDIGQLKKTVRVVGMSLWFSWMCAVNLPYSCLHKVCLLSASYKAVSILLTGD